MKVYLRQGDSFWYYSQLFQIPLNLISDSNPTLNPQQIMIGQEVAIPGFILEPYQIQSGDTFYKIAEKYNLHVDSLMLVNQRVNPNALQVGSYIQVPVRVVQPIVNGNRPYNSEIMMDEINQLLEIYPFMKKGALTETYLENPVIELQVGTGDKKVHWNGSFHANEWITTPIIMTFLNDYLLALTNQSSIRGINMLPFYSQVLLSIVPMVNPDGVDLVINGLPEKEPYRSSVLEMNDGSMDFSGWKANIRGVDLNNQFPAQWEIEKERKPQAPGPRDYPGPSPLSEAESLAMANLTRKRDFDWVLAFHTQGEVIYWGFMNLEPPYAETIVNEFSRVSGYVPIMTVDSYAGYKDWFIQDWQRPGYTVELGKGVNPLPLSQFDEIYEETIGIFLASMYM
ncbi:M14 family metallopeptidase [Bacillus solimangrovi]|uniref:Peptidase M14 n=1 Tax=Bacillus solimangrovi TaxID=1305675 RepID=A0A1E5LFR5_9BACI|nr:M14 family metallopeptidase [Bacillus solimangrovi]OEH92896.1 peptidase M14 [Bacillus solimangrovi]